MTIQKQIENSVRAFHNDFVKRNEEDLTAEVVELSVVILQAISNELLSDELHSILGDLDPAIPHMSEAIFIALNPGMKETGLYLQKDLKIQTQEENGKLQVSWVKKQYK